MEFSASRLHDARAATIAEGESRGSAMALECWSARLADPRRIAGGSGRRHQMRATTPAQVRGSGQKTKTAPLEESSAV
jgi:hypothetical protein